MRTCTPICSAGHRSGDSAGRPQKGRAVAEKQRAETRRPDLFRVFLLNDDYTTMDFVVMVLETVFGKHPVEATRIMLHVHNHGRGLAGVYVQDIAESKASRVHNEARLAGYPLRCVIEKESSC